MITSSVNRVVYRGNGVATEFAYPFKIFNRTDIKVLLLDKDGNRKVLTSDYYVDMEAMKVYYPGYAPGAAEPGADRPSVLAEGETLVVYREVPIDQMDRLPENYPFNVIEKMDDKSCVIDQQLADEISRSIKFGVEFSELDFDSTLPIQAGYGWRVSDDGKSIVPLQNVEKVYQETVSIKNETMGIMQETIADAEKIKQETAAIRQDTVTLRDQTEGIRLQAIVDTEAIKQETLILKNETETIKAEAEVSANLAERWAQSPDSPDGGIDNRSSKSWAELSKSSADEAARQANYCTAMAAEGSLYDTSKTYEPGNAVMTPDGSLYRCIAISRGESPTTSAKWVLVSMSITDTFENDENGDLMPLLYPKTSNQFDIDDLGDIMPAI